MHVSRDRALTTRKLGIAGEWLRGVFSHCGWPPGGGVSAAEQLAQGCARERSSLSSAYIKLVSRARYKMQQSPCLLAGNSVTPLRGKIGKIR